MKNIHEFSAMKARGEKITMVTCYDYTMACLVKETPLDCILVGDSLAMVMYGHKTTIPAKLEYMVYHTQAVARAKTQKFLITDLPFLSYRKSLSQTMDAVEAVVQAGAQAIKLEGAAGNLETIAHIVESGIPVMGHIGLMLQSFHQQGGFKIQGKDPKAAEKLLEDAKALEAAGCFALLLECIPSDIAKKITESISIPTIGIGAGTDVNGQVLVFQDLLGLYKDLQPKFVKKYLDGFELLQRALTHYHEDVKTGVFPSKETSY